MLFRYGILLLRIFSKTCGISIFSKFEEILKECGDMKTKVFKIKNTRALKIMAKNAENSF